MTRRSASATAVLVCQGRAIADGRFAPDRFADPIARELLDPPELELVDRVRAGVTPEDPAARVALDLVRLTGLTMVARTIAIDDAVRDHAAGQVVLLGAGLDTRAWRMPELAHSTVFEVDHRASGLDKARRIGDRLPLASRVVPVAVDLAAEPLAPALARAGFEPGAVTTWVWEGVVPYLNASAVRAIAGQVAALSAPGSLLAVQYQARSFYATVSRWATRLVVRASGQADVWADEPWRSLWRPSELARMLRRHGFADIRDRTLRDLADGLGLPGEAAGSLGSGRVALAVRR